MKANSNNIIYVYPSISTFIEKDIKLLSRKYHVTSNIYPWLNKRKFFINLIKQLFFLLRSTRKSKAVFVMFAGHWSILPVLVCKLFSTPCYVILGGSDCVSYPEFNYGSLRKSSLRFSIKVSIKYCSKLIPVAKELMEYESNYFDAKFKKQGILSFFKNIKTPWTEIPNGYLKTIYPSGKRAENSFISIAKIEDETRFVLKGMDQIEYLAKKNRNFSFILIGIVNQQILERLNNVENITTHSFLSQSEIKTHLRNAEYYLQLSISEGHPNALCEAMSEGCIPIGSDVSSIPRIIGDTGFIVPKCNSEAILSQINKITSDLDKLDKEALSRSANERINTMFSLELREKMLFDLLS